MLYHDLTRVHNNGHGPEPVSAARSCNAAAIIEAEQGIMRGTLNIFPVETKKLVRHPVKRAARMGTAVQVSENLVSLPHDKHIM